MLVFLLLWPQLLPSTSGEEALSFRLSLLIPPQLLSSQPQLTGLGGGEEIYLVGGAEKYQELFPVLT